MQFPTFTVLTTLICFSYSALSDLGARHSSNKISAETSPFASERVAQGFGSIADFTSDNWLKAQLTSDKTFVAATAKSCWRKPGAEVTLLSREFVSLNPGEIKEFSVDVAAVAQSGQLHIEIQPEKGLQLLSEQHHFDFDLSRSGTINLPVQLRSNLVGNWVLNLMATVTDSQGQTSSRALALIVQVGNLMTGSVSNNSSQQKSQSTSGLDGDAVVIMPALEVIH